MIKKIINKIILGLFIPMTNLHAETILCPEINRVQYAANAINIAVKYNNTYSVYTEDYVLKNNQIYWRIEVKSLKALSEKEALQKGKKIVEHVFLKNQVEATQISQVQYSCSYGPGDIYTLGIRF